MSNSSLVWPSSDCNGIALTDPVSLTAAGTLLVFARAQAAPAQTLYYNVRRSQTDSDSPAQWLGWNELPMIEPSHASKSGQDSADQSPQLRVAGMDLLTVGPVAASPTPADAPFRVVSDGTYIAIFRQSTAGSIYVDRFVLVEQSPSETDAETEASDSGWLLRRAWEVRYRRSEIRDIPAGAGDTLGPRNMNGEPFLEPTVELPVISGITAGQFAVGLVPTTGTSKRWHVVAITGTALTCLSYPQDATGRIDVSPAGATSFAIKPTMSIGTVQPLTPTYGIDLAMYEEQEAIATAEGPSQVRRAARVAIAVPVRPPAQSPVSGLPVALAVFDFSVQPEGTIPAYPSDGVCVLLDGEITNSTFTPSSGSPNYTVPVNAIHAVSGGTVGAIVLGQAQASSAPMLVNSADGLLHCYFAGQLANEQTPFLVAQLDPSVTRAQATLPAQVNGGASSKVSFIAQRTGTTFNELALTVANCPDQADLCNLAITYGTASGLPGETWRGVPRDVLALIQVLNGASSGDAADPAILAGTRPFYDAAGKLAMARLPVTLGTASGNLTLASHRPDMPLASAVIGSPSSGKTTLTLTYTLPGGGVATQTWSGVPTATQKLVTILAGDASPVTYPYTSGASDTPLIGLATDAGAILLVGGQATVTVSAATNMDPTLCDVKVQRTGQAEIELQNVEREQGQFVAALLASSAISAVFTHISPDPVSGSVPNQVAKEKLDLRSGSILFNVITPVPAGDLSAGSATAAVLQGHALTGHVPPGVTAGNAMLALAARASGAPLFGQQPAIANGTSTLAELGQNGSWLRASVPEALTFNEQNAMEVRASNPPLVPGRRWTIETWARPTDGSPSRVIAYNNGPAPSLAAVTPSYFLGTVGLSSLQYSQFAPTIDHDGSYVNVPAAAAFAPAAGGGFTWEAWVRPNAQPGPPGRLGCVMQAQDNEEPVLAQCQLGIASDLHLSFGYRSGSLGSPTESYLHSPAPLPASTWTHVAVTGSLSGTTWTIRLYVNARLVQSATGVTLYPKGEAPFLCIGASDMQNVSIFGAIAELRGWAFARGSAELARTMSTSLFGTEPGLVGYWPLSDAATGPIVNSGEREFLNGSVFANRALSTGSALNGHLKLNTVQSPRSSSDGEFVSIVTGVGGAPAINARGFLPANRWNHLAVAYEAPGALAMNPGDFDTARIDYGVCSRPDITFGQQASIEAWIQTDTVTVLQQTILAKWGVTQSEQSFCFGLAANGTPSCSITVAAASSEPLNTITAASNVNVRDGKPHHLVATYAAVPVGDQPLPSVECTVTLYVDGVRQTPGAVGVSGAAVNVITSRQPLTLGMRSVARGSETIAIELQAPFQGVLTGVRFWSIALTEEQVAAAMTAAQAGDGAEGVISAWWFGEDIGTVAHDDVSNNDFILSDTDMWAAFGSLAELQCYGNGVPIGLVMAADPTTTTGYLGAQQATVGAYISGGVYYDGFGGSLAELRLWNEARTQSQIIETMYRPLAGNEHELNAYWQLNGSTADLTGNGSNGTLIGSTRATFAQASLPVANEGPYVRNVYGGAVTELQEPIVGRAAVVEYAETEQRWDGSPYAVMRRAYIFCTPALALITGYGLGEIALVYLGQVQTRPTLIGYIEGAPPVPSENLTQPFYNSTLGYNSYMNSSSVSLQQTAATTLTFTSSDYRTRFSFALDLKGGLINEADIKKQIPLIDISFLVAKGKAKIGVHSKIELALAQQIDHKLISSWTRTSTDTLSLRGAWEPPEPLAGDYLNPQVGRRYEPLNLGYALVESLTADLYLMQLRATGVMVGKVVVPNLELPPDRNIMTFPIDPAYVKNGTLDGKVGLVNDPAYPNADVARGSYFQPAEAYRLAGQIERAQAQLQSYFEQFDAEALGQGGPGSPSLEAASSPQFYDFGDGVSRRGIANRYVWSALGGLHAEVEQFSSTQERTYTGFYNFQHGTGVTGELAATLGGWGVWGSVDLLFGGQIKIQVSKDETDTAALALTVTNNCDPILQGYDPTAGPNGTWSTAFCPGKVNAYRFMTFYLPPATDNAEDFLQKVVDRNWLEYSSDPNASALRSVKMQDHGVWRVLHRVTYVSRVPPPFDSNPSETVAPDPELVIDVEDNPYLAALVASALGNLLPTPQNVGSAVAVVLAPSGTPTSLYLGNVVPWWDTFVKAARREPGKPVSAVLDRLLLEVVAYMQAGYQTGALPIGGSRGGTV